MDAVRWSTTGDVFGPHASDTTQGHGQTSAIIPDSLRPLPVEGELESELKFTRRD